MTFRPTVRAVEASRELRWLGRLLVPASSTANTAFASSRSTAAAAASSNRRASAASSSDSSKARLQRPRPFPAHEYRARGAGRTGVSRELSRQRAARTPRCDERPESATIETCIPGQGIAPRTDPTPEHLSEGEVRHEYRVCGTPLGGCPLLLPPFVLETKVLSKEDVMKYMLLIDTATPRYRRPRSGIAFRRMSSRRFSPATRRSTRLLVSPPASGCSTPRRQRPCGCRRTTP